MLRHSLMEVRDVHSQARQENTSIELVVDGIFNHHDRQGFYDDSQLIVQINKLCMVSMLLTVFVLTPVVIHEFLAI
jgi:hypothetical protein